MTLSHVRILLNVGKARKSRPPSHRPLIGEIKRTGVRWLPSVAKACLHIGFCKFSRRLNGAVQCVQMPPYGLSRWTSIFRAMALAMCVEEEPRYFFAIMRASAI